MLAFLLLSRENRWSSKSHHACMFGRVATEVNTVKIRPMHQMIRRFISKAQTRRNGSQRWLPFLYSHLWGTGTHTQVPPWQLDAILIGAKKKSVKKPKEGNKNQKPFEKMLIMEYELTGIGVIKMTVGVRRRTHEKVQYCITSINSIEKRHL